MRHPRCAPIALLALLIGSAVAAQSPVSLQQSFAEESRRLDLAIQDYGESRARERRAVDELRRLGQQLDEALADPNASLDYLMELEAELAVARETAYGRAQDCALARKRIYDRMARLGAVARDFERQTDVLERAGRDLSGMWQIEVRPIEVYGLLNLRVAGAQVSGPYRLSNGRRGSVQGTLAGNRLDLQVIDSQSGPVATIRAEVNSAGDDIAGTWQTLELASGRPSSGAWLAEKVSPREEVDLEF